MRSREPHGVRRRRHRASRARTDRGGHRGPRDTRDDAPTLHTIELCNGAVATSGSARRGVWVADQWHSHVLDPRTGHPACDSASVTVVAPNASTADVVATIVSVMEPAEGLQYVDLLNVMRMGPIECWIVDQNGRIHHAGR